MIDKKFVLSAFATGACLLIVPFIVLPLFFLLLGSSSGISEIGFFVIIGTLFLSLTIISLTCLMFLPSIFGLSSATSTKAILLVLFCACVNSTFFFGTYGLLNGSPLELEGNGLVEALQIIFFLSAAFYVFWRKDRSWRKNYFWMSFIVVCISITSFSSDILMREKKATLLPQAPAESDEFFSFSLEEKNVLLLIADELQTEVLLDALEKAASDGNEMQDFIVYRDNVSNFPTTVVSLPAILTGQIYDNQVPWGKWIKDLSDLGIPVPMLLEHIRRSDNIVLSKLY